MRKAKIEMHGIVAGVFEERERGNEYTFNYIDGYSGPPISLTMFVREEPYMFNTFPPFFDGLLPEGVQLEALLREKKIDRNDPFSQLVAVGQDLVGAVTLEEII